MVQFNTWEIFCNILELVVGRKDDLDSANKAIANGSSTGSEIFHGSAEFRGFPQIFGHL